MPRRLVLASRGSRLALTQARLVADLIAGAAPDMDVEIRPVTTTGDRDGRPFEAIGGKGLFVAEVEREVAEGRADVAVHSAKDLTASLAPGCAIVLVPPRAAPQDVVVGGSGATGEERLASLHEGATVGTSSMRRRALVAEARPDLDVVNLRGNIDTRLRKVFDGVVDAAVLAAAGLERLGVGSGGALDPERWVPPPGQGALAVEARADRHDLATLLAPLTDPATAAELACERAFAGRLEGGCSVPLGCLARVRGGSVAVVGFLGHPDGSSSLRDRISGPVSDAPALGTELAEALLAGGGAELLAEISG